MTPLHSAASGGYVEVADLLLGSGADIEANDFLRRTPLHIAAGNGHLDVIKLLVDRGAKIRTTNYFTGILTGMGPQDLAYSHEHWEVVKFFDKLRPQWQRNFFPLKIGSYSPT